MTLDTRTIGVQQCVVKPSRERLANAPRLPHPDRRHRAGRRHRRGVDVSDTPVELTDDERAFLCDLLIAGEQCWETLAKDYTVIYRVAHSEACRTARRLRKKLGETT